MSQTDILLNSNRKRNIFSKIRFHRGSKKIPTLIWKYGSTYIKHTSNTSYEQSRAIYIYRYAYTRAFTRTHAHTCERANYRHINTSYVIRILTIVCIVINIFLKVTCYVNRTDGILWDWTGGPLKSGAIGKNTKQVQGHLPELWKDRRTFYWHDHLRY